MPARWGAERSATATVINPHLSQLSAFSSIHNKQGLRESHPSSPDQEKWRAIWRSIPCKYKINTFPIRSIFKIQKRNCLSIVELTGLDLCKVVRGSSKARWFSWINRITFHICRCTPMSEHWSQSSRVQMEQKAGWSGTGAHVQDTTGDRYQAHSQKYMLVGVWHPNPRFYIVFGRQWEIHAGGQRHKGTYRGIET